MCGKPSPYTTHKDFTHSGSITEKEEVFVAFKLLFRVLLLSSQLGGKKGSGLGMNKSGVYVKQCDNETYGVSLFSFACSE